MIFAENIETPWGGFWLGGQWEVYGKKPNRRLLLSEAKLRNASHYCIYPPEPPRPGWLVGFWHFESKVPGPKDFIPLAPNIAEHMGEQQYWLFDFGGRYWALMTNAKGVLTARSDIVVAQTQLTDFESGLKHDWIANKKTLSKADFATLKMSEARRTVRLTPTNRSVDTKKYLSIIGLAVVSLGLAKSIKDIVDRRASQAALAAMEARRLQEKMDLENIVMPPPREWLKACMTASDKMPYFYNGWILSKWVCHRQFLEATWARSGGSVTGRPEGILDPKGDEIIQTLPLHVAAVRARRVKGIEGLLRYYAIVQPLQIENSVVKSLASLKAGERGASYAIKMKWTVGDPGEIDWDTIPGLYFTELTFETGLSKFQDGGYARPKNRGYVIYGLLDRVGRKL